MTVQKLSGYNEKTNAFVQGLLLGNTGKKKKKLSTPTATAEKIYGACS